MKAAQLTAYGGPEVIQTVDVSEPTLTPDHILVKVHAASINPFDEKLVAGYMKDSIPLTLPITVGGDFAGIVTAVGENVTDIKVGDEVYGSAMVLSGGSGSFAEMAITKPQSIAMKPKNIDFRQAAAVVLVGSSAVQAIEEHINLQPGQKILIHGGAGGIGSIAIQLAKSKGAYVATTVSQQDMDFVKGLGADEVIDYKNERFDERLKGFDAVYDTVGGETMERSLSVLKPDGILVSMLGKPDEEKVKARTVTAIAQATKTNTAHLTRLAELIDNGIIKPQVDKVFPLDQASEAFAYAATAHPRGKVVVSI